jgi:hypothetical protein
MKDPKHATSKYEELKYECWKDKNEKKNQFMHQRTMNNNNEQSIHHPHHYHQLPQHKRLVNSNP